MKRNLLVALFSLQFFVTALAQSGNIVIFSEGGERFTAILNGERINTGPATNVKVTDLNQPGYKLKVIFEDNRLGEVSKDIMVSPGEETVYMVKLDKKGSYKVAWRSATPLAQAPVSTPSQQVYAWGAPSVAPTPVPVPAPAPATQSTTTVVVQETVSTTAPSPAPANPSNENISMNVNVPGFNMNVNVNGSNGSSVATNQSSAIVTTTTTTTTTSTPAPVAQPVAPAAVAPCGPMDATSFDGACKSIKSKSFDDSQMTVAKQIANANCLSTSQIKSIMGLFSFEDSRLEFAKFAWSKCTDRNNYYLVNDAFTFESTIEELDRFIQSQR
jgi:hypothetical protein